MEPGRKTMLGNFPLMLADLAPGADSSFDTGSLHLTNMTPQEARWAVASRRFDI